MAIANALQLEAADVESVVQRGCFSQIYTALSTNCYILPSIWSEFWHRLYIQWPWSP